MAQLKGSFENGDAFQPRIGNPLRVEEGITKFNFLDLPGEIRNMIYKLLVPTPYSPQVIRIDYSLKWPNAGSKIDDEQQLALGLYRTCKIVNNELSSIASLEYLLSIGAIIPAANLEALVDIWAQPWAYGQLCKMILPTARRLRIRSDYALDSPTRGLHVSAARLAWNEEQHYSSAAQFDQWVLSGRARLLTRAFFRPPMTKYRPDEKTLELSCPWKDEIFNSFHIELLSPLLDAIGRRALLGNVQPLQLRMRGDYYDHTLFRKFNRSLMIWVDLKLGVLGPQQTTTMVTPGSALYKPTKDYLRGDEVFHPLPNATNYWFSKDCEIDQKKFIKWSSEELLKMNKRPRTGLTPQQRPPYNEKIHNATTKADKIPEGLQNLLELEDYLGAKHV